MDEIVLAKSKLRERILLNRKQRTSNNPEAFCRNLESLVSIIQPKRVALYRSYLSEPDTSTFISKTSLPTITPKVIDEANLIWEGIEETEIQKGDLLIIPALAVDLKGNRLGRGKGYFDRELAKLPEMVLVYAMVFDDELLSEIPVQAHDRKVNGVITESGIHKIN
ncbi:MAG: hypothetical protein RIQ88_763 [Actinomycetota bacterium]|jgi:5-formyltetrahydrofolate cyclo-ligase